MNKGGRPRKTKGLINVAKWLPQMRRACSRQIVLDQLDALERDHTLSGFREHLKPRIAQIKKDVANIQS
jgi:hypothetical protein